jgi:hypothetical protein
MIREAVIHTAGAARRFIPRAFQERVFRGKPVVSWTSFPALCVDVVRLWIISRRAGLYIPAGRGIRAGVWAAFHFDRRGGGGKTTVIKGRSGLSPGGGVVAGAPPPLGEGAKRMSELCGAGRTESQCGDVLRAVGGEPPSAEKEKRPLRPDV